MITLHSHAKVNLYLEIVGPRHDGYTNVALVFQSIALHDRITLTTQPHIKITCTHPLVPLDHRNIAYSAVELIQKQTGINAGVHIHIEKYIPIAAGLAGGSGNGAAVLVGLNQLWNLKLSPTKLLALAAQLGSDVPFCLMGGTALGYGRGEILSPLPSPKPLTLVLVKPRALEVSAAWAYRTYRNLNVDTNLSALPKNLSGLLCYLVDPQPQPLANFLHNDLEQAVLPHHPQLQHIKDKLQQLGATGVLMSGSGPTIFGLTETLEQGHALARNLQLPDCEIFVTQSDSQGIVLSPT